MQHVDFVRGVRGDYQSVVGRLESKEKQFSACLEEAEVGAAATIEIRACLGNSVDRYVTVATLELSEETPVDCTPIVQSLLPNHYAVVTDSVGCSVWVFGDC